MVEPNAKHRRSISTFFDDQSLEIRSGVGPPSLPFSRRRSRVPSVGSIPSSMNLYFVLIQLIILLGGAGETNGQENPRQVGIDLCACSPRTFEFTFDFSLVCPPINITEGKGVQSTSCLLSPFSDPDTTDLVPSSIQSIDIVELGQDVSVLVRESITGNFVDGDTFVYESIINTPEEVAGPNDIPRVLQMNIVGLNQIQEEIINVFIITYSNNCQDYPVLFVNNTIGWTRMSKLGSGVKQFCPAFNGTEPPATEAPGITTDAPASVTNAPVTPTNPPVTPTNPPVTPTIPPVTPTNPPVTPTNPPVTPPPTIRTTPSPTRAPIPAATPQPTRKATASPTAKPVSPQTRSPTRAPVPVPTRSPTKKPTSGSVVVPTRLPTTPPSDGMSMPNRYRELEKLFDNDEFGKL